MCKPNISVVKKAKIFDWNRTIHPDKTDIQLHAQIGRRILLETIIDGEKPPYSRALRTAELGVGTIELTNALRRFKLGKITLGELNSIYNRRFICGQKTQTLEKVIEEYARRCCQDIDQRVVNAIRETRREDEIVGILSASIESSIKKMLEILKIEDLFNVIIANELIREGDVVLGISSRIYGNKKGEMERFSKENKIDLDNIVYMGDCEDDAAIAPLLRRGGFIVSFMAEERFKNQMAKKYGAFVPENERDLIKYLKER
jgi:phosphoserine phosphatase